MESKIKNQHLVLMESLKVIENAYNEAMYDNNDIYRVKDLIHSLDTNHWKSKTWTAHIFYNTYVKSYENDSSSGHFLIVGGWYGLLAHCLRQYFPHAHITSSDMDPMCERFGSQLFPHSGIEFKTFSADEADLYEDLSAVFCTSIEHMDPKIIQNMIDRKGKHTWVILQSTNMQHPSHVNMHKTYEDLEKAFTWPNNEWGGAIEYSNSQPIANSEQDNTVRHMVIAR